jgi:type I restriction enzyme S subunit
MDRPWIEAGLKYATVSPEDRPCLLVQRVSRLRGVNGLSTGFLRYVVGSRAFTQYILAVQTGTAVPHISGGQIADYRFLLPSRVEQERITETLGALDDKIELNRRMNRTLESIASAIFKAWFVDSEPVRKKMEGGEAGPSPSVDATSPGVLDGAVHVSGSFRMAKLTDLVAVGRDPVLPQEISGEVVDLYSIPAFDEDRMPAVVAGTTIKSNKFAVPQGSVLVSRLNPRIRRVWLPRHRRDRRSVCSTEFLVLAPKPPLTKEYLYGLLCSDEFSEELASRVTGTSGSHQRVKPSDALSIPVALPSTSLIDRYSKSLRPLLEQAGHLLEEDRVLTDLRDALLPQLIGGGAPSCEPS